MKLCVMECFQGTWRDARPLQIINPEHHVQHNPAGAIQTSGAAVLYAFAEILRIEEATADPWAFVIDGRSTRLDRP
jgi:hypothetical protein